MTGRWRPLPTSLDPETAYLVGVLRELKDRSRLSLAALAARTPYSKSSWERYLNGAKPPPRPAVEALARQVGEPVDRLVALWERAEARWSGRTAGHASAGRASIGTSTAGCSPAAAPEVTSVAAGGSARRGRDRLPGWLTATLAVCGALAVLAALARPLGLPRVSGPRAAAPAPDYTVGCRGAACAGGEPEAMGCAADAASFANLRVDMSGLELRISDQCAAGWARFAPSAVGDQVFVEDRDGHREVMTVPDAVAANGFVVSPMIGAARHSAVRACVRLRNADNRCTPWGAERSVPVLPALPPPKP
jgi:hypothetical protein